MQEKTLKSRLFTYYLTLILNSIALSIPHAILTVLLLSKGIKLYQIAAIQLFYNIAMTIFEFPSGVISDIISRRWTFLFANITLIIAYFIILIYDSYILMSIAWFLYGLSTALSTGTIESDMINYVKINKMDYYTKLFKNSNLIALVGMIIGASLGQFLYNRIDEKIYIVSILLLSLIILIIIFNYPVKEKIKDKRRESQSLKTKIVSIIKEGKRQIQSNIYLKYSIITLSLLQIFFQLHFHYWQALSLEYHISKKLFFIIYILFQFISIGIYNLPVDKFNEKRIFPIGIITIGSILWIRGTDDYKFLIGYMIIVAIVSFMKYYMTYILNKKVEIETISTITSFDSTMQRLCSILTLSILNILLRKYSLISIFYINSILVVLIFSVIIFRIKTLENEKG
ncbi:MAG: MFS transporter, partial [Tissierellia bacterium]|nr:MFS transporter [Tissierellia bacterium]